MKYVMEFVLQVFLANTTVPMFNIYSTKKRASRASALRADGVSHTRPLLLTPWIRPTPWTRPQIPLGASPSPHHLIIS